jgi:hypothetical protein
MDLTNLHRKLGRRKPSEKFYDPFPIFDRCPIKFFSPWLRKDDALAVPKSKKKLVLDWQIYLATVCCKSHAYLKPTVFTEELLEKFVHYGGIKTVLIIFTRTTNPETQRFAALAIANVSSLGKRYRWTLFTNFIHYSKATNCQRIREEGTIEILLEYIEDNDNDIVARQYSAMAIGNISALEEHQEKVVEHRGNLFDSAIPYIY